MTIYTSDNALEALLRIGLQHTKKLKKGGFIIFRNTPGQRESRTSSLQIKYFK